MAMHACTPKCLAIALLSLGWFQKLSSVKNELIHYSLVEWLELCTIALSRGIELNFNQLHLVSVVKLAHKTTA